MEAKELRIGNFVNRLGEATTITAIQITGDMGYVSTRISGAITQNQIEPIPLTEEWFEKFNFKEDPYIGYIFNDQLGIMPCVFESGTFYRLYADGDMIPLTEEIKYVHQLQNLFFALTGEELKIK